MVKSLVREYRRGRLAWLALDMLERRGVRHGFTLRYGGVSRGKFASLNFTTRQGDGEERVRENSFCCGAGGKDATIFDLYFASLTKTAGSGNIIKQTVVTKRFS